MLVAGIVAALGAALLVPGSPNLIGASRPVPLRGLVVGSAGVVALLAVTRPRVAALALVGLGAPGCSFAAAGPVGRRGRWQGACSRAVSCWLPSSPPGSLPVGRWVAWR